MLSSLYVSIFLCVMMAFEHSYSGKMDIAKLGKGLIDIVLKNYRREHTIPIVLNAKPTKFYVSPAGVFYLQNNYPAGNFPFDGQSYKENKWRTNPQFVKAVESHSDIISGFNADLQVQYISRRIYPYPFWVIKRDEGREQILFRKIKNKTIEELTELRQSYYRANDILLGLFGGDFSMTQD